ncbi:MAG: T9SS type A sorting domain-containing protein [Ignavibacteriales bacterium]|nr:T9SS type A sorting domain-containing protein [Ignavibacteriales bacterium]
MRSLILTFLICLGSLSAQTFIGRINPFPESAPSKISFGDTLKILAVMADFQEDKDAATYGTGKFGSIYSSDYGTKILDPLPHDKNYFQNHLEFAKNYFRKVSKGKVTIGYEMLPDIFTVSKTMRNYSPPTNSDDLSALGNFSKEIWQIVAASNPSIKFSDYNIFLIFHSGVGRDISSTGSLGTEKDLPSVYLSDKALKNIFNGDLTGLPQNKEGKYNTMIIPETESRESTSFDISSLLQLSINGLIVSSIASHIGLPDLFDTKTGLSAIGRFGLMDGQSIFTYSGAFPPEPSAWEKIYLGWEQPIESGIDSKSISIVANLAATLNDTTILKVPINSTEYFLVENRNRDVNKDGSKISYVVGNELRTKIFPNDMTGFYSWNIDSLSGVITDVDEYDWALPGSGIIIWHIDENVINANLADNKINIDKFHRGVDVEEADGVQDIGEKFQTIFGYEVIGEGTEQDLWYKGNKAKLYKNKFTKDTQPNTNSYSGANSLISFTEFSPISNRMSFKLSWGDSLIKPVISRRLLNNNSIIVSDESNPRIYSISNNYILVLANDGSIIDSVTVGSINLSYSALINNNNSNIILFSSFQNSTGKGILSILVDDIKSNKRSLYNPIIQSFSSLPVIRNTSDGNYEVVLGTDNGKVYFYSLESLISNQVPVPTDSLILEPYYNIFRIAADKDFYSLLLSDNRVEGSPSSTLYESSGKYFLLNGQEGDLVLTKDKSGNYQTIIGLYEDKFYLIQNGKQTTTFNSATSPTGSRNVFSMGDLLGDGNNYIFSVNSGKLEALNLTGGQANNFPFIDPQGIGFEGTPLIVDFAGDNNSEIITYTQDGRIFAIDGGSGKVVNGFPISVGESLSSTPVFFNDNGKASLAAITNTNHLYVWNISLVAGTPYWASENADNLNSSFVPAASSANAINSFFPKERAYNWPNPVYEDVTNIRYFVGEDSKINIKIFDLAGGFVTELNDFARGGFDNETVWNVKDIQSGVYFARVEASGSSGKTENNIIKIAVIK